MNQSEFVAIIVSLPEARERQRGRGAIGFGFHSLKDWREQPIAKRSNCNRVITFNSHLKTASWCRDQNPTQEGAYSYQGTNSFATLVEEREYLLPFERVMWHPHGFALISFEDCVIGCGSLFLYDGYTVRFHSAVPITFVQRV